jgi:hypothetical protein
MVSLFFSFFKRHNQRVNPTARACTFLRLKRLLSDSLFVGFMVALAAGYPYR